MDTVEHELPSKGIETSTLQKSNTPATSSQPQQKKLTPAQKKQAKKVQAQRDALKAAGKFNPVTR